MTLTLGDECVAPCFGGVLGDVLGEPARSAIATIIFPHTTHLEQLLVVALAQLRAHGARRVDGIGRHLNIPCVVAGLSARLGRITAGARHPHGLMMRLPFRL